MTAKEIKKNTDKVNSKLKKEKKQKENKAKSIQSAANLKLIKSIEAKIIAASNKGLYEICLSSSRESIMNADVVNYFKKEGFVYSYNVYSSGWEDTVYTYVQSLSWENIDET